MLNIFRILARFSALAISIVSFLCMFIYYNTVFQHKWSLLGGDIILALPPEPYKLPDVPHPDIIVNNTSGEECITNKGASVPCDTSEEDKAKALAAEKLKKQTADILKHLTSIPAFYNTPSRIPYKKSTSVTFVLETQGKGTARALSENVQGAIVSTDVLASSEVQAVLTGPADLVEITFRGPAELQKKAVSAIAPVQWTWDVKGVGLGTAELQLELLAFIQKIQGSSPVQVRTFHQKIPVEISLYDRIITTINDFTPIWVFLVTIVTGIGGLLTWFNLRPTPRKSASA